MLLNLARLLMLNSIYLEVRVVYNYFWLPSFKFFLLDLLLLLDHIITWDKYSVKELSFWEARRHSEVLLEVWLTIIRHERLSAFHSFHLLFQLFNIRNLQIVYYRLRWFLWMCCIVCLLYELIKTIFSFPFSLILLFFLHFYFIFIY